MDNPISLTNCMTLGCVRDGAAGRKPSKHRENLQTPHRLHPMSGLIQTHWSCEVAVQLVVPPNSFLSSFCSHTVFWLVSTLLVSVQCGKPRLFIQWGQEAPMGQMDNTFHYIYRTSMCFWFMDLRFSISSPLLVLQDQASSEPAVIFIFKETFGTFLNLFLSHGRGLNTV